MGFLKSVILYGAGTIAIGAGVNPRTNPLINQFRADLTRQHMRSLRTACQYYLHVEERPPANLADVVRGGYMGKQARLPSAIRDPFGNTYAYRPATATRDGVIVSAGPDCHFDTRDDIREPIPHPDEHGDARW